MNSDSLFPPLVLQAPIHSKAGFSLIEVLVVLLIIGVLLASALPSYRGYMGRLHRADARNALIQAAQWMERAATATGRYPTTAQVPTTLVQVPGGRYNIQVLSPDPLQPLSLSSFRIVATRNATGSQAQDACGDFSLDQANRQMVGNNLPSNGAAECWRS